MILIINSKEVINYTFNFEVIIKVGQFKLKI